MDDECPAVHERQAHYRHRHRHNDAAPEYACFWGSKTPAARPILKASTRDTAPLTEIGCFLIYHGYTVLSLTPVAATGKHDVDHFTGSIPVILVDITATHGRNTPDGVILSHAQVPANPKTHEPMMRPRPKSLPLVIRLSLAISLVVIGGISVLSITVLKKQSEVQSAQIHDFTQAMAEQLASSATEPLFTDDMLSLSTMVNRFAELPRISGVAVINNEHQILTNAGRATNLVNFRQLVDQLANQRTLVSPMSDAGDISAVSAVDFRGATGGYVYVQVKTQTLAEGYIHSLQITLLVSAAVMLATLIFAYVISRHVSRPIDRLIQATEAFGQGKFDLIDERRNDEIGRLIEAINLMGQGLYRKTQVEALLSRFLAKDIADEVLDQLDTVQVGGERVEATVLFADIVGFTRMSEQLSPEQVAELLNEYFSYFTVCSRLYFGTVDKFIGDCAMVVFGTPKADRDHLFHAVCCAVLMQKLTRSLNAAREAEGKPQVQLRIGINSGSMLAGVLGTQQRMEYTVVGDSVNLASRLCNEAEAGQIVITETVHQALLVENKVIAHKHREIRIRGKNNPVDTYLVDNIGRPYQFSMDSLIDDVLSNRVKNVRHV